ncbi:hypothetical protein C9374_003198 [Naegleria lovaniensis]|uniref:B box-type domain-containing protein n=1 Tax=Naegleria lovaniensis TaxID=51637 RepID=A0AA88KLQ6_NAELO|nr:uncharacterized protein C9374_003198 [Naegleria lovaniensis]KAG2386049.1 hypothetical protein C9374_003198 [Naegleria lovaniensis]
MFIRCCRDCQEEEVEVEANHTCQTCSCHLCDFHSKIHVRKNKNHQITTHSQDGDSVGSSLTLKKCNQHQSEINCFCRDCEQLVCSLCAVSQHVKHNVFLIECIVQEERKIVKDQLDRHLKQRDEWMKQNSISEQVLQKELGLIENTGTDLKNKINTLFEQLIDQLYQRRDVLLKKVDSECTESTQLVRKVMIQMEERIALENAFSDISTMHGNELLDKKVGLLKNSTKLFNEMTSQLENVNLHKVHNICLERTENRFYKDVVFAVNQLGTVNKYYDKTQVSVDELQEPIQKSEIQKSSFSETYAESEMDDVNQPPKQSEYSISQDDNVLLRHYEEEASSQKKGGRRRNKRKKASSQR